MPLLFAVSAANADGCACLIVRLSGKLLGGFLNNIIAGTCIVFRCGAHGSKSRYRDFCIG